MIVAIKGRRFDTDKAKRHWQLMRCDPQGNRHTGDLYLSSQDTWYIETPSQWANGHRWELIDPQDAVELYGGYLDQAEIADIIALAGLVTE